MFTLLRYNDSVENKTCVVTKYFLLTADKPASIFLIIRFQSVSNQVNVKCTNVLLFVPLVIIIIPSFNNGIMI